MRSVFPILLSLALWSLPAAAEPCAAPELEVATLNTWGLPYPLSRNRKARFEKIQGWLDSGIDIIGLQEVWSSARGLLPTSLRLPTSPRDSGLAVVTPHPSTRPTLTAFDEARGFDALKTKGVLTSRIELPDGSRPWIAVAHLQSGHSTESADVRAAQVAQLLGVVRGLDGPVLLMGDFNLYADLDADIASAKLLTRHGYADVAHLSGADEPTYRTGSQRLDRIYARNGTQREVRIVDAAVKPRKAFSDHHPVRARVRLCRAQSLAPVTAALDAGP